jgi:anti-sigma factor RsiW
VDCECTRELLNAYLDGELPNDRQVEVTDHLRGCAACTKALAELEDLNRVIATLPGATVPEGFARRVREAAEQSRVLQLEAPGHRVRLFGDALTRLAAAVMAVAGLAVGMAMGQALPAANSHAPASDVTDSEVLALQTDGLSAVPEGSLSDVYLAFVSQDQ